MIKYGLISDTDARTLEKTLDLILEEFTDRGVISIPPKNPICVTEIGLFDCGTANGIVSYISPQSAYCYTGIDNEKDKPILRPAWMNLIIGNSNEVYNQLEDNSQHLIFVDGCHCFAHVVSDFFCYAPKVKTGGYFAFHDTGKHIKPMKDFQHGDKNNPDAYISVRKALGKVGAFNAEYSIDGSKLPIINDEEIEKIKAKYVSLTNDIGVTKLSYKSWQLIFDESDPENEAGGICVFKKLY